MKYDDLMKRISDVADEIHKKRKEVSRAHQHGASSRTMAKLYTELADLEDKQRHIRANGWAEARAK